MGETQIRALREQSNQAIAAHDADRTVSFMAPDIAVGVAGGPTLTGREASRVAFLEQFADKAFVTYVRTIDQVTMVDPMRATERGRWVGRWRLKSGMHEQGGSYGFGGHKSFGGSLGPLRLRSAVLADKA